MVDTDNKINIALNKSTHLPSTGHSSQRTGMSDLFNICTLTLQFNDRILQCF